MLLVEFRRVAGSETGMTGVLDLTELVVKSFAGEVTTDQSLQSYYLIELVLIVIPRIEIVTSSISMMSVSLLGLFVD